MGEYADMALDAGFSHWEEDGQDEYVGRFERHLPKMKTCRRCGETGLHWRETDDGWRLHKTTGLWEDAEHECEKPTAASAEGIGPLADEPKTTPAEQVGEKP